MYFFIDDIDRASGEQIRDILSELKIYISNPRIVAILGYDEDYVLNALKSPVLYEGINPQKYVEKIITVRRKLPIPNMDQTAKYASALIQAILKPTRRITWSMASRLCKYRPRKLRTFF